MILRQFPITFLSFFFFFAYLLAPIPDTSACVIDAPWSSMASKLHDMSTILNSTLGPQTQYLGWDVVK